jgi:hypothetical protein
MGFNSGLKGLSRSLLSAVLTKPVKPFTGYVEKSIYIIMQMLISVKFNV